jgi:hypothetical protein
MFNELATIFGQDKNSSDLAETSQPSVSESPQPPSTATTSGVSSGTLSRVELDAYESFVAKRFHEESSIQALKAFFEVCRYPTNKQVNKLSSDTEFTPERIRNWFKTQRARERAKDEGVLISSLREEISKLRSELSRYKEARDNITCAYCGKTTTLDETPLSLSSSFPPMPSDFFNFTAESSDIPQSSYVQDEDVTWLF